MKLIYIAGPFNGDIEQNVCRVEMVAQNLVRRWPGKLHPVVPHSLGMALFGIQPEENAYAGTLELLRRCDALVLAPHWRTSKGAMAEREEAHRRRMPIFACFDCAGPDLPMQEIGRMQEWLEGAR